MWCATECTIGGDTVGEEGECRLNGQFALWSWVKNVWCDKQFQPTESTSPSEMTDWSAGCALLHECCKCRRCIAGSECAACNAQRIGELRVSIA
jgi:hypothetical protein